jgi:hypothetical protein
VVAVVVQTKAVFKAEQMAVQAVAMLVVAIAVEAVAQEQAVKETLVELILHLHHTTVVVAVELVQ